MNYPDCDLDCDPEYVPIYTRHSLFNTTKQITLLFIVQSLLYCNPPNILIKIIQIKCLHRTKFLDPNSNLDLDLDNFAWYKRDVNDYPTHEDVNSHMASVHVYLLIS